MTEQLSFFFTTVETPCAIDAPENHRDGVAEAAPAEPPDGSDEIAARKCRLLELTLPAAPDRPATLTGCLAWAEEHLGKDDPDVKQVRGAVLTITRVVLKIEVRAKALEADLPADPIALRPLLSAALPAALNVSVSRWSNAKSLLKTLLIATGWVSPHARPYQPVSPAWQALLTNAPGGKLNGALRPFLRHCDRLGVKPENVSAEHLASYEEWLTRETLDLRPRGTVTNIQTAWRRLQRIYPEWPRQELKTPSRVLKKAMAFEAFPQSFEVDVLAYMAALRNPDPLDPEQTRPMSEISVQHTRRYLLRAATLAVGSGVAATEITGIAKLVELATFRSVVLALHEEGKPLLAAAGETAQWTLVAEVIANTLVLAARRWVRVPPAALEKLIALRKRIKPRRGGLSNRVQDRLADLATDEDRQALHSLPWQAFDMAERMLREEKYMRAAKLHETALALAIVLRHPLRHRNLTGLDVDRHFVRNGRGKLQQVSIPASEVKNRVNIRFDVGDDLATRIERHLSHFRPHVPGSEATSALFPGMRGKPREPQSLGRHIRRLVEQQLGKRFHVHLARHLAVDILLEADSRNLPLAQKLLAHQKQQTTEIAYGGRVTLAANRKFQDLLREQADRKSAHSGQRAKRKS